MTDRIIDEIAAQMYDHVCAFRSKDGKNPRESGPEFHKLLDGSKNHYRALARWHLTNAIPPPKT